MDLAFVRSAFSPVIAEALDRSDGIYHLTTGELIAQGELGLPVFVGTMQFTVQAVIERVQRLKIALEPGDVFIVNDPYLGGTHLMDVKFVQPFFRDGRPWCWLANTGHWPDTGGMVPGGFSANATEVEQEGLRLPPVKLYKRGVIDDEILSIILSNIRIADQRIGDIKAQAAALATGERRLDGAARPLRRRDRRGRDRRAEACARRARCASASRRFPTASTTARPSSIRTASSTSRCASRCGSRRAGQGDDAGLTFDMSGSSPPCKGPMNSVIATTKSSIYLAVKHVFPEVSINAGTFEPLHIVEPEGTFLYARYPRPVSGCAAEVSQRIAEAVFAALGRAIPDQLFGAPAGTSGNLGVGGFDPKTKRAYVMYVISGGGYGGSPHGDGISNGCSTIGISKTTPIEIMEQLYPVLFEEYSLHEGSGGAGRAPRRLRRQLPDPPAPRRCARLDGDGPRPRRPARRAGRRRRRRQQGRRSFATASTYVPEHLSKDQDIEIHAGDVISVSTPGGGGFGDAGRAPGGGACARRRARLLQRRGSAARCSARRHDAMTDIGKDAGDPTGAVGRWTCSQAPPRVAAPPATGTVRPRSAAPAPPVRSRCPPRPSPAPASTSAASTRAPAGAKAACARSTRSRPGACWTTRRSARSGSCCRNAVRRRRAAQRAGDAMKFIDFWFDPISPYAYLAFERMPEVLEGLSYSVSYRPVLFGAPAEALGPQGPGRDRAEARLDLPAGALARARHGIEMQMPAQHPFNPLALLRLAAGLRARRAARRTAMSAARSCTTSGAAAAMRTIRRGWPRSTRSSRRGAIRPATTVKQALRDADRLRRSARGMFGVPTMRGRRPPVLGPRRARDGRRATCAAIRGSSRRRLGCSGRRRARGVQRVELRCVPV